MFPVMFCLFACHRSPSRDQMIAEIIKSGVENPHFQGSSKELEQLVSAVKGRLTEADTNQLRQRLNEIVSTNSLSLSYQTEVATNFSDSEIKEVYDFSKSSISSKILSASRRAATTEGAYELQIFQTELAKKPLSPERKTLLEEYMRVSGTAELSSQLMLGSSEFFASLEPTPEKQKEAMKRIRTPSFQTMIQSGVLLGSYFSLRELSDSELKDYLIFLKSAGGSRLTKLNASQALRLNQELFRALNESLSKAKPKR